MIKNNLYRISLVLVALVFALSSCENKVEIVDQDLNYQLDPDFVFVEIPEEFDFDPSNVLYVSGQTHITLNASNNGETTEILQGNSIPLNLKIKRALDYDIVINMVEDEELLISYPGNIDNFISLPQGSYSIPELVIPSGSKDVNAFFTIDNPDDLHYTPGYILPLKIEVSEMKDDIKISTNRYTLFIKIDVKFSRDNIDSSGEPFDGDFFNSSITFLSNKTSGLAALKDGNTGGSYWYPTNNTIYLEMLLPVAETITGMRFHTTSGNYQLSGFNVFVEEEGRGLVSHGTFSTSLRTTAIYVKFKEPIKTNKIRIENSRTISGGSQPDFTEVYLVR